MWTVADAVAKERPARMIDGDTWITAEDYSASAIRARQEGTVAFELSIGVDGRTTGCRIETSSGSASLDETTCTIMKQRARFEPARDARGRPATTTLRRRVTWKLPQDTKAETLGPGGIEEVMILDEKDFPVVCSDADRSTPDRARSCVRPVQANFLLPIVRWVRAHRAISGRLQIQYRTRVNHGGAEVSRLPSVAAGEYVLYEVRHRFRVDEGGVPSGCNHAITVQQSELPFPVVTPCREGRLFVPAIDPTGRAVATDATLSERFSVCAGGDPCEIDPERDNRQRRRSRLKT